MVREDVKIVTVKILARVAKDGIKCWVCTTDRNFVQTECELMQRRQLEENSNENVATSLPEVSWRGKEVREI